MDPKLAEAVGLFRHQIISPVLLEKGAAQMAYFRLAAHKEYDVPGRGAKRFTPTTMKAWLYRYRKNGLTGLLPKTRCDAGGSRKLRPEIKEAIAKFREDNLDISCVKFYDRCLNQGIFADQKICIETLRHFLKAKNLYRRRQPIPRKRFEMSYFGELWTCDFMHGPQVLESPNGKRRKKAILMAIIDDHSRLIVGHRFGFVENTQLVEQVFKEALLTHGLTDRVYCDNGAAFSSQYLSRVCAHLGISLIHSKPYDSPSRGKIERFFRTVREGFLVEIKDDGEWDLKSLNDSFDRWLRDQYHHRVHHGIDARPIDRYQISIRNYPRKRVDEETLNEFFLVSLERTVNRDATLSLHGVCYEVPPQYIGQRVEIRFPQDRPNELYLYDNDVRMCRIQPVDPRFNGKQFYKPSPRISDVALHQVDQNPKKEEERS
ncbi:DDE-type integrase/transposase/recombinase [Bdellovibrionota bacterium FG-2]